MKHITKCIEPATFTAWKTANPGATYATLSRKNKDAKAAKAALKLALIAEQHGLCCYCESRISPAGSHIEHFRPKGNPAYAHLQLDYGNLHASCLLNPTGSADEHCGHKKSDTFSANLISPLEPDCATHFTYTMDGKIGVANAADTRGTETISILHLDSALLNAGRKALIDYFINLDPADIPAEVSHHLDTTATQYGEYFTMIEYLSANHML